MPDKTTTKRIQESKYEGEKQLVTLTCLNAFPQISIAFMFNLIERQSDSKYKTIEHSPCNNLNIHSHK